MRVVSWNVNGLRACVKKGFVDFLTTSKADIIGVQEVRANLDQIPEPAREPPGWHANFVAAERRGYSGVGIYSKQKPDGIDVLGEEAFDVEGRLIIARFGRLHVVNGYFPKGSGKDRDNSRVPYKLDFYQAVFERVEKLRRRGPVLILGDYNTAHHPIDLARPKTNLKSSGFLPEERQVLDDWETAGWVDSFRKLHPEEPGHYTWWRQWGGARENNVGWRIDYVFASPSAMKRITSAFIWPNVTGSDHCPVCVDMR
jgi:exodeoxyribonuclease-3